MLAGETHPSSHAERLLKSGDSETWGSYEQGRWRLFIPAGTDEDIGRLASIHESLHSELDRSTAYGLILHTYALVVRNRPGDESRLRMLENLTELCRNTHETFATTMSVFVLGEGRNRHDLLRSFPDYARYYRIGCELASPFRNPYIRYHAVLAALRFCMQSELLRSLRDSGPVLFDLSDHRALEYPDARLLYVRQQVARGLWSKALKALRDRMTGFPDVGVALIDGDDVPEAVMAFEEQHDHLSQMVAETLYAHLEIASSLHGVFALSFNGHREIGKAFLENAARELPRGALVGPLRWAEADAPEDSLVVRDFDCEQLLVSREAWPARLSLLADIPLMDWPALTSGSGEDIHRFLVSRSPLRLLQQHAFSDKDQQVLQQLSDADGLFVRRRVTDSGGPVVEYYLISDAADLNGFVESSPSPVFSNLSLALASDHSWASRWFDILKMTTIGTVLCDVSPFSQIDRWIAQEAFSVHYSVIAFSADADARYSVIAFWPEVGAFPVCLAPCSHTVATAFTHYLRHIAGHRHRLLEEPAFLKDRADAVRAVLSHVFREEHFFDFAAGTMLKKECEHGQRIV